MENEIKVKIPSAAAEKAAERARINLLTRVDRTEMIKFFQNKSGFASLPGYTNKQIHSREARIKNNPKGWVIPESCYGRKAEGGPTGTMRESIREWIVNNLSHLVPEGSEVSVCLENWHEDGPRLVIYRKVMK